MRQNLPNDQRALEAVEHSHPANAVLVPTEAQLEGIDYETRRRSMISRRLWIVASLVGAALSACAVSGRGSRTKPRMGFRKALALLPSIRTEADLTAILGATNNVHYFRPGTPTDVDYMNSHSRDSLRAMQVFLPPTLVDTLPTGTRMLVNMFSTRSDGAGGALVAYVDEHGDILGWSYSKGLTGRIGDNASLEDE